MKSFLAAVLVSTLLLGSVPPATAANTPNYSSMSTADLERAQTSLKLEVSAQNRKMLWKGGLGAVALVAGGAAFAAGLMAPGLFAGPAGALLMVGGVTEYDAYGHWQNGKGLRAQLAEVNRLLSIRLADAARQREYEAMSDAELLLARETLVFTRDALREAERMSAAMVVSVLIATASSSHHAPGMLDPTNRLAVEASRRGSEALSQSLLTAQAISDIDHVLAGRGIAVAGSNVSRELTTRPGSGTPSPSASAPRAIGAGIPR